MNILIKNATIVTMGDEGIIENGYLATEDKKIKYVGATEPEGVFDHIVDGKGKVIIPGLSNAHGHTAMSLLRSYSEGYKLQEWLFDKIFPIEDKLGPDEIYTGTLAGIAELLRFGCTITSDSYFFMDSGAKAYIDAGFNANLSRGLTAFDNNADYSKDYRINEALSLYKEYNGASDDLIRVELSPHAVYTCEYNYLKYIGELAVKYSIPVTSHLSENETEVSDCIKKYGKTPVEIYKETGLLEKPGTFAHCVWLNDKDIELLRGHYIAHCPKSNLKLGSGIADIYKYKEAGINIALGTDGASSNNSLNMLSELNYMALLMCNKNSDPSLVSPYEILKTATLNGARAMGRDKKGILKEGYDADFVIIKADEIYHLPNHNPVNNLVYASTGCEVETTVIGGKILYDKGEYKTIDIEKLKWEIRKIKEKIF